MHFSPRWPVASVDSPLCVEGSNCRWIIVIAGSAPELPEKLLRIGDPQRMLVFECDAICEEDTLPASMLELLVNTVLHRNVEAIVVFGQSKDIPKRSRTDGTQRSNTSGYSLMLQRMSDRMESKQRAQNRVRAQLNQIRLDARLARASTSRAISLCGLFHITESNVFMVYDCTEDRFVPLVDASQSYA